MNQVLQNFSAGDCKRTDDGHPVPGSIFEVLHAGRDPNVDADFLTAAWTVLYDAIACFCEDDILKPEGEATLLACLEYTQKLVPKATSTFDPREFDAFLMDYDVPEFAPVPGLAYDGLELISAYIVLCVDKAISAMLACNAQHAAKFAMFAGVAATLIPFFYESAQTTAARKAAEERHEKDPKQKEKKFVHDCWTAWQLKPDHYKFKATFAKDMLEKCEHLQSQKKIEDWCREWEAAASAREAKKNRN